MTKKKKESLMDATKSTMGIGIGSMAGLGAMGAMGAIPGMPAQASGIVTTTSAGLGLVGVGRMAKTGMLMTDILGGQTVKKKSGSKQVDKILGN